MLRGSWTNGGIIITKFNINDIVVYNHQGVLNVGIIVKMTILGEESDVLYQLNNGETILEDVILEYVGNVKRIQERVYDDKPSSDDIS